MDILSTSNDWALKKEVARTVLASRGIHNVHIFEIRSDISRVTIWYYPREGGILNRILRGGFSKEERAETVDREVFVKEMTLQAEAGARRGQ